jgi:CRISPR-associated exonuclease Cas4
LREKVEQSVAEIRSMLTSRILPPAVNDARCKNCSLQESCLPSVVAEKTRLKRLEESLFVTTELANG